MAHEELYSQAISSHGLSSIKVYLTQISWSQQKLSLTYHPSKNSTNVAFTKVTLNQPATCGTNVLEAVESP